MTENKNTGDKTLHVPAKTLTLKRPVEQGMVRQSFSHGRTKAVVVEKVKRRVIGHGEPPAAPTAKPAAPAAPAPASPEAARLAVARAEALKAENARQAAAAEAAAARAEQDAARAAEA